MRSEPLPLEFHVAQHYDQEEADDAVRMPKSRSPYNYYGLDLQSEVGAFEKEFAVFLGVPYEVALSSGTGALHVALPVLGVGLGQAVILAHAGDVQNRLDGLGPALYTKNTNLPHHASADRGGFPWNLAENSESRPSYGRGACPPADSLFERSAIIAIPSCLTAGDKDDIILEFE